jgi:hypothetical protein
MQCKKEMSSESASISGNPEVLLPLFQLGGWLSSGRAHPNGRRLVNKQEANWSGRKKRRKTEEEGPQYQLLPCRASQVVVLCAGRCHQSREIEDGLTNFAAQKRTIAS